MPVSALLRQSFYRVSRSNLFIQLVTFATSGHRGFVVICCLYTVHTSLCYGAIVVVLGSFTGCFVLGEKKEFPFNKQSSVSKEMLTGNNTIIFVVIHINQKISFTLREIQEYQNSDLHKYCIAVLKNDNKAVFSYLLVDRGLTSPVCSLPLSSYCIASTCLIWNEANHSLSEASLFC